MSSLVARFPDAFAPRGARKQPLKIGIRADILALWPEASPHDLDRALMDYTSGFKYLVNLTEGAARIDLSGHAAGAVTADEAKHAAARRAKLNRAADARRNRRHRQAIEADPIASIIDFAEDDAA
jgi:ProP effector